MYSHCLNCLRTLTDPRSKREGFGPECAARLKTQQAVIDAGRRALDTGACQDSKLLVLGRILKRHERGLMLFTEKDIVPEVVVRSLNHVRRDFTHRAQYLASIGQVVIDEPVYQVSEVVAA